VDTVRHFFRFLTGRRTTHFEDGFRAAEANIEKSGANAVSY
jgi:hypothetical protein